MNTPSSQKGASIIAVIAIMLILAVMGAALVSLVTTGSDISVNQLQSEQAFYIADGGLQYTLAKNKSNIPNYSTTDATFTDGYITLGAGQFKVDTPAYLTSSILAGATTIPVNSTASFPSTGRLMIGTGGADDFGITYTNTDGTNFLGASGGQAHNQYNSVYPAARLGAPGLGNNCTSPVDINVDNDTGGFDISCPFFIDTEYFYCTAKTANQFQNCTRCYAGSSSGAHPANNSYASQYILTSTGRITSFLSNNVQRVVRISAGPQ